MLSAVLSDVIFKHAQGGREGGGTTAVCWTTLSDCAARAGLTSITCFLFLLPRFDKTCHTMTAWWTWVCCVQSTDVMLHHLWVLMLQTVTAAIWHCYSEQPARTKLPNAALNRQTNSSPPFRRQIYNLASLGNHVWKWVQVQNCSQTGSRQHGISWQKMEIIRVENGSTPLWKITKAISLLDRVFPRTHCTEWYVSAG